jgi:hypothetical protein
LSGQRLKTLLEITRSTEDCSVVAGFGKHLGRHVDADDLAVGTDPLSRQECVETATTSQVEDRLTGLRLAQRERVADPAEGLGHGGWQGINLGGVVAEPLGALRSDRELALLVR